MNPAEKAIEIALKAHIGKVDKAGQPYILHPLRVALKLANEDEITAAILHDVVEDSDCKIEDLKNAGFNETVIKIVELMTRTEDRSYDDYINGIKTYPPAVRVKLADLEDNMNLMRIKKPETADLERIERYKKAYKELSKNNI